MIDEEKDKKLYRFLKHIEFIRGYFKDGQWINFVNPKHVHINGITRKEAEFLYKEECKKQKKCDSMLGRIKSAITQRVVMVLDENYKTLLELMDILHKDFIDEKDLDNILVDVEAFYNNHYNKTDNKELEN